MDNEMKLYLCALAAVAAVTGAFEIRAQYRKWRNARRFRKLLCRLEDSDRYGEDGCQGVEE